MLVCVHSKQRQWVTLQYIRKRSWKPFKLYNIFEEEEAGSHLNYDVIPTIKHHVQEHMLFIPPKFWSAVPSGQGM